MHYSTLRLTQSIFAVNFKDDFRLRPEIPSVGNYHICRRSLYLVCNVLYVEDLTEKMCLTSTESVSILSSRSVSKSGVYFSINFGDNLQARPEILADGNYHFGRGLLY